MLKSQFERNKQVEYQAKCLFIASEVADIPAANSLFLYYDLVDILKNLLPIQSLKIRVLKTWVLLCNPKIGLSNDYNLPQVTQITEFYKEAKDLGLWKFQLAKEASEAMQEDNLEEDSLYADLEQQEKQEESEDLCDQTIECTTLLAQSILNLFDHKVTKRTVLFEEFSKKLSQSAQIKFNLNETLGTIITALEHLETAEIKNKTTWMLRIEELIQLLIKIFVKIPIDLSLLHLVHQKLLNFQNQNQLEQKLAISLANEIKKQVLDKPLPYLSLSEIELATQKAPNDIFPKLRDLEYKADKCWKLFNKELVKNTYQNSRFGERICIKSIHNLTDFFPPPFPQSVKYKADLKESEFKQFLIENKPIDLNQQKNLDKNMQINQQPKPMIQTGRAPAKHVDDFTNQDKKVLPTMQPSEIQNNNAQMQNQMPQVVSQALPSAPGPINVMQSSSLPVTQQAIQNQMQIPMPPQTTNIQQIPPPQAPQNIPLQQRMPTGTSIAPLNQQQQMQFQYQLQMQLLLGNQSLSQEEQQAMIEVTQLSQRGSNDPRVQNRLTQLLKEYPKVMQVLKNQQ